MTTFIENLTKIEGYKDIAKLVTLILEEDGYDSYGVDYDEEENDY